MVAIGHYPPPPPPDPAGDMNSPISDQKKKRGIAVCWSKSL